jgi:hypothetical protein
MATNAGVSGNELASKNIRTTGGSPKERTIARRGNNGDFHSLIKI